MLKVRVRVMVRVKVKSLDLFKDADKSDLRLSLDIRLWVCQRTYIGRTTLKEFVNHPLKVSYERIPWKLLILTNYWSCKVTG